MRKFKKVVASVLATAMVCSLAVCGGETSTSTSTSTGTTSTSTESTGNSGEASSDAVTINLYRKSFNIATVDEAQLKKVEDAINTYIADKINAKVKLTEMSGDYEDKANLAFLNGEADLLWTASWEGTIGTKDLYAANAVYDITDLIAGTTLYNSMDSKQWEASKYGGKNYFIPVYKDNVEGYDIMFRKDLVDKYGWDVSSVKKFADIEPMLADCKAEGLKYPFLTQKTPLFYRLCMDGFDFFTGDSASNWVAVDRKTNEVVNPVLTPEYEEFCTLMSKWAEAGYVSEDDATKTTTDQTIMGDDWGISWWTDVPNNAEANGRYGREVVMAPATKRYLHTDSMLGSCYCISAKASPEVAKACIDFMGLLYTDSKLADMYTYGIEGEDFEYTADGLIDQHSEKYNHSMWESASATAVTAGKDSPYTPQMYIDFNNSAEVSCANGFHFDKSPVEAQYTACTKVFEEYGFGLENGAYPSDSIKDTIAQYAAALDEAGYQEVLAEMQNQYNNWK